MDSHYQLCDTNMVWCWVRIAEAAAAGGRYRCSLTSHRAPHVASPLLDVTLRPRAIRGAAASGADAPRCTLGPTCRQQSAESTDSTFHTPRSTDQLAGRLPPYGMPQRPH